MDLSTLGFAGALAGAMIAVGTVVIATIRLIVGAVRSTRRIARLLDRVLGTREEHGRPGFPSALDRVDAIHAQVFPNGGGSLRDAVDNLATSVDQLDRRFTDHLVLMHRPDGSDNRGDINTEK